MMSYTFICAFRIGNHFSELHIYSMYVHFFLNADSMRVESGSVQELPEEVMTIFALYLVFTFLNARINTLPSRKKISLC